MTTPTSGRSGPTNRAGDIDYDYNYEGRVRAMGDETKPSWKSTELFVYLAAVAGVLIAAQVVGDRQDDGVGDIFAADKAWWYITLLTIGYLISRGLAKAGSQSRNGDSRGR